jgi:hypothetical protein
MTRTGWVIGSTAFLLGLFGLLIPASVEAATYSWIGPEGGNTSVAANWTTNNPTSCVDSAALSPPGGSDTAVFDPDCDNGATINSDLSVMAFNMQSGYTGTVSQNAALTTQTTTISGGTLTGSSAAIGVQSTLTISGGTLTAGSGTITASTGFTVSSGTFNEGTSTVNLNSAGSITYNVVSTETFYKLTFSALGGSDLSGDTAVVTNLLTLNSGAVNNGALDAQGDVTVGTGFGGGTATLTFSGAATQAFTFSEGANGTFNADITVNKSGGQVNLASALVMDAANQDLTLAEGTFDLAGNNLTVNGTSGTLVVQDGGNLQLQGSESITANSGNPQLQSGSTVTYDGTSGSNAIKNYAYHHLTINGSGGTFTLPAATDVNGNLTITAGTLDATTSNFGITLAGNWSNSGTFTARSGTVTLDGTNQTLSGATTFYNLSKTVASAATLTFPASTTTTVTNAWTAQGASGQLLSLRSSSSGTQWQINPSGTRSVEYVDVKDSNNTNATAISCTSNCTNSGNNTNWNFGGSSNNAPTATTPSSITAATDGSGEISFKTTLADADSDKTQLLVEYSTTQSDWKKATLKSVAASRGDVSLDNNRDYPIYSVDTDEGSVTLTVVWDAQENFASSEEATVYLRVTPYDGTEAGSPAVSEAFAFDTQAPTISALKLSAVGQTTIKVMWEPALDETHFQEYSLCIGTTKGSCTKTWTKSNDSALSKKSTSTTTITGLTSQTTYYVTLTAEDTFGNATTLSLDTVRTLAPSPLPADCAVGYILLNGQCVLLTFTVTDTTLPPSPELSFPTPLPLVIPTITPEPVLPLSLPQPLTTAMAQKALAASAVAVAATAAVSVLASSATLTAAPTLLGQIPYLLRNIAQVALGILGFRSRRRPWGRVVDSETGSPLPGVYVQLIDHATARLRDSVVSNEQGAFSSLLAPGTYDIRIHKPGWTLTPSAPLLRLLSGERIYDGRPVTVSHEQVVALVLALRPLEARVSSRQLRWRIIWQRVELVLARLSWPLLIGGAVLNTISLWSVVSWLTVGLEISYGILIVTKLVFNRPTQRAHGTVTDAVTNRPLDLAMVRLYDAVTGNMVATRVTSGAGTFLLLPSPGVYTLMVQRPGYEPYREAHLIVHPQRQEALALSVALQPQSPVSPQAAQETLGSHSGGDGQSQDVEYRGSHVG